MDPALLAILACPKCLGKLECLEQDQAQGLACASCAVVYPIEDEIPVLLVEAGIAHAEWPSATQPLVDPRAR